MEQSVDLYKSLVRILLIVLISAAAYLHVLAATGNNSENSQQVYKEKMENVVNLQK